MHVVAELVHDAAKGRLAILADVAANKKMPVEMVEKVFWGCRRREKQTA